MGVYSQFAMGTFDNGTSIVADESYIGAIGAYQMMTESEQNTQKIFEHILTCDFAEASKNYGFISESSYESINEASIAGIFSKVADFFRKLGEKIKGIINNFIKKIQAMFTKDGKKLIKKFDKDITKKLNDNVYDDNFKYTFCDLKNDRDDAFYKDPADLSDRFINTKFNHSQAAFYKDKTIREMLGDSKKPTKDTAYGYKNSQKTDNRSKEDRRTAVSNMNTAIEKGPTVHIAGSEAITSDDITEYKNDILATFIGGTSTTSSDFSKDYDEYIFEDSDSFEGFTEARRNKIKTFLDNESKYTNALEKSKSKTEKGIKDIIKEAEDIQKEMNKLSATDDFSDYGIQARAIASNVIKLGNACNQCVTTYFTAYGAAIKKMYSQSRSLYIKAGTYNKKKSSNESTLMEAIEEVSNYEVDQMMPEF